MSTKKALFRYLLPLALLSLTTVFASDTCFHCNGQGRITCPSCYGAGSYGTCLHCNGVGFTTSNCLYCNGSGYSLNGHPCYACKGTGIKNERCSYCNGTGTAGKCLHCNGTGIVTCPYCHGSGQSRY